VSFITSFPTLLGDMVAIGDHEKLFLLSFFDSKLVQKLKKNFPEEFIPKKTKPLLSIENEVNRYFNRELDHFETPCVLQGTFFQNQILEKVKNIPLSETRSYSEIADEIRNPLALRAVAQAVGSNRFHILVPCHRVIGKNGSLRGYNAGIGRKEWLLNHEQLFIKLR
jgi:O-6-methylguanine DNA methyltransferase